LHELLQRLRLGTYFSNVTVSCDAGFAKPSPVIFEQAATKLGVATAAILHVGDSFELDVLGAKSAGLHALRIRRGQREMRDGDLASLSELPAWMERFSAGKIS
jgi:putative hydrolase of the HAD superfamily